MIKKLNSLFKDGKLVLGKTALSAVGGILITSANIIFYFGVSSADKKNDFKELKELVIQNQKDNIELKKTFSEFVNTVNNKFTKVYDDEYKDNVKLQNRIDKKLELIIDYGSSNKKLLKDVLNLKNNEDAEIMRKNNEKCKNDVTVVKSVNISVDSTSNTIINYDIRITPKDDNDTMNDIITASSKKY